MNFNKVIIGGNLVRDPEMRYTPSNTAITSIGIAVNRKWKNQAGEMQEEATFVDCEAWGRTAEVINEHFRKGRPIFIEGRLKLDVWTDKDGGKRSKLKVVVESFQFCGGDKAESKPAPSRQHTMAGRPAFNPDKDIYKPMSDENIPFAPAPILPA